MLTPFSWIYAQSYVSCQNTSRVWHYQRCHSLIQTTNPTCWKHIRKNNLPSLFMQLFHITCMTHIMNSIGSAFYVSFTELNAFIIYFSRVFFMGVVWKRSQIGLAMAPCANHWNSWFSAAIYNSRHFSFYRQFFFRQKCIKNKP